MRLVIGPWLLLLLVWLPLRPHDEFEPKEAPDPDEPVRARGTSDGLPTLLALLSEAVPLSLSSLPLLALLW